MEHILKQIDNDITTAHKNNEKGFCVLCIYWQEKYKPFVKKHLKDLGYTDYILGIAPIGFPYAYYYFNKRHWLLRTLTKMNNLFTTIYYYTIC